MISVDSLLPDSTIYFISFTFRSGTNLLCDYLSANGLGFPAEYFQHPYRERNRELFEELDIQNNDLATYLERLLLRRSRNGVFGVQNGVGPQEPPRGRNRQAYPGASRI